jgi:hypothetical protein
MREREPGLRRLRQPGVLSDRLDGGSIKKLGQGIYPATRRADQLPQIGQRGLAGLVDAPAPTRLKILQCLSELRARRTLLVRRARDVLHLPNVLLCFRRLINAPAKGRPSRYSRTAEAHVAAAHCKAGPAEMRATAAHPKPLAEPRTAAAATTTRTADCKSGAVAHASGCLTHRDASGFSAAGDALPRSRQRIDLADRAAQAERARLANVSHARLGAVKLFAECSDLAQDLHERWASLVQDFEGGADFK